MKAGDTIKVLLNDEEHKFTMVAGMAKTGELNVKAPLAILLNIMSPGDAVSQWIPREGGEATRVELIEHKQEEN